VPIPAFGWNSEIIRDRLVVGFGGLGMGVAANIDWSSLAVDPFPATQPNGAFYPSATAPATAFGFQAGLTYRFSESLNLGLAYTSEQFFNVAAPAVIQHHASLGFGLELAEGFDLSAAHYRAFANEVSGPIWHPMMGQIPQSDVSSSIFEDSFVVQFSFHHH